MPLKSAGSLQGQGRLFLSPSQLRPSASLRFTWIAIRIPPSNATFFLHLVPSLLQEPLPEGNMVFAIPLSPHHMCVELIYRKNPSSCSPPWSNNNLSDKFMLLENNWNTDQFAVSNFNETNKLHFLLQILTLTPPPSEAPEKHNCLKNLYETCCLLSILLTQLNKQQQQKKTDIGNNSELWAEKMQLHFAKFVLLKIVPCIPLTTYRQLSQAHSLSKLNAATLQLTFLDTGLGSSAL